MDNIHVLEYVILTLFLYVISLSVYLKFNMGLAKNAIRLQARRYLIASSVAVLPLAVAQVPVLEKTVLFNLMLALFCGTAYNVIFHLSNRKCSPDYDNRIDLAYGIYLFGWLTSLKIALMPVTDYAVAIVSCSFIGVIAFVLMMLAVIQWGHYLIYGSGIEANSIQATLNTDIPEFIEFVKSFPKVLVIGCICVILFVAGLCIWMENLQCNSYEGHSLTGTIFSICWAFVFFKYIWLGHHCLFRRTGLVRSFLEVKEYARRILRYKEELEMRLNDLKLTALGKNDSSPHTYILVIGESANRDYMSAYVNMEQDTTPWLVKCKNDKAHHVVFTNAYSCANQTVPSLERALTERNQYNNKEFYESFSIVDIARKAGYNVSWYSNQGYIGEADTSISLVAKTADTAKWVKLEGNRLQYDGSLLEFLDEVNPEQNNLIVFHLNGSHFNFINRYPKEATQWGEPGVQDNVLNYLNSLHYTDSLLEKIYDYASEKLNLQAMIYFSDHACVPDKRRVPHFTGFDNLRIPLSVHCTENYVEEHKERFEALKANKDKYFTNDLIYELFCGVLDVESNHFDFENSLARKEYKWSRDMLLTNNGQTYIKEDECLGTV